MSSKAHHEIVPGIPTPREPYRIPPLAKHEDEEIVTELNIAHAYPPVVAAEFDDEANAQQVIAFAQSLDLSEPDAIQVYRAPKQIFVNRKPTFIERLRMAFLGMPPPQDELPEETYIALIIQLDRDDQIEMVVAKCKEANAIKIDARPSRRLRG